MKRVISIFGLLLVLLFSMRANAQVRVLVGPAGAVSWSNQSLGIVGGLEIPFAKRYEIDVQDIFSPIESHAALGSGKANVISATGLAWITPHWGVNGRVESSMYSVTKVSKNAYYAFGGLTYRHILAGAPSRISFDYVRQFHNGVTPAGIESSHLQGVNVGLTVRVVCTGLFCIRFSEDVNFGRVWEQGNPACDGSLGPKTCGDRKKTVGGGVVVSVILEFPRRRQTEDDIF